MNPAEIQYSYRNPYPAMYQRGRAAVASMPVYRDGVMVVPTAAGSTFSFLAPDGTALVDAAAVSVSVAGLPTSPLSVGVLSDTVALGEGYQEIWKIVHPDGTTRTIDREAAIIRRPLVPVLTDDDLKGDYPLMARELPAELTSFQGWIDEAWKEILGRLISEGHCAYLIKSSWSFRGVHKNLVHAKRFRALAAARATQENYRTLATEHMAEYEAGWKGMNFTVDLDHDGRVDDPSARSAGGGGIVHINAAPTRHPSRVRDPRW